MLTPVLESLLQLILGGTIRRAPSLRAQHRTRQRAKIQPHQIVGAMGFELMGIGHWLLVQRTLMQPENARVASSRATATSCSAVGVVEMIPIGALSDSIQQDKEPCSQ
jgi:hypothetical protein